MSGSGRAGGASLADDERSARAHLSRVVEPGDVTLPRLLGEHGWRGCVRRLVDGRAPEVWQERHDRLDVATSDLLATASRQGIRVVVPGDPSWPAGLYDLDEWSAAPACLWVRGELPGADRAPVAVALVGARACTAYGQHVAEDIAAGLVEHGWTVVSGAAYGIDAAAHRGAVAAASGGGDPASGLPTVAVLAGGVDRASPAGHERLLGAVLDAGGAVVAEVPPGTRPAPHRFLLRNRLIAAWSRATVVVEAGHRSGALSTVRSAVALGRDVGAVPGPVTSGLSAGCNALLRESVPCIRDAADVVGLVEPWSQQSLDLAEHVVAVPPADGVPVQSRRDEDAREGSERVLQALRRTAWRDVGALVVATGLPARDVAVALGRLELAGLVERSQGRWRRGAAVGAGDGVVP
ncbi:DNA-processing protein DprA [Aquipuribacter nitratireducens]|uniref:DNA-processing protein DprA n=1 Tax=Aquipuribacter nitratireducens TaxID=650104 RepID=A0ABW0GKE6_9MICO